MSTVNLPKLPALPSASRKRASVPCACGCGGSTQRTFVPGHDSYLKGWVLRVLRGLASSADLRSAGAPGVAAAVDREVKARKLAGIKWSEFPVVAPARSA